jgi:hypothetical protein
MRGNHKRQHYLPEFYLKRFARQGLLWVYDRELDTFRRQPPNKTAVERHRYSFVDDTGKRNTSVESHLERFESRAAPVINKMEQRLGLHWQERAVLAWFVGQLHFRVPAFDHMTVRTRHWLEQQLRGFDPQSSGGKRIPIEFGEGATASLTREEVEAMIQKAETETDRDKLHGMLKAAFELGKLFMRCSWVVAHVPPRKSFVTSDSPMAMSSPPGWIADGKRVFGPATPGVKRFVPLSPSTGLLIHDVGPPLVHLVLTDAEVRQCNTAVTVFSERFVIARDEALLRSLVKATHLTTRLRNPRQPWTWDPP